MSIFTDQDYRALHALVFRPDYPGYRPTVVESPNGDPTALDTGKKFAHVATKYLGRRPRGAEATAWRRDQETLTEYLITAHQRAVLLAGRLGVPPAMWPSFEHGALRVLEYPAGQGGHVHTDFDLFAINAYRNVPNPGLGGGEYHLGEIAELIGGLGAAEPHHVDPLPIVQHSVIYFAIPDHAAVLPSGQTVGEWMAARVARSRYDASK